MIQRKPWLSERATKFVIAGIFVFMFAIIMQGMQHSASDPQANERAAKELAAMSRYVFVREAFGCRDWDTWQLLGKVTAQGDKQAFAKVLYPALAIGTCRRFKAGDVVFRSESALLSGSSCMRPDGEVACFWTSIDATSNARP